jgi:hypothetical protein
MPAAAKIFLKNLKTFFVFQVLCIKFASSKGDRRLYNGAPRRPAPRRRGLADNGNALPGTKLAAGIAIRTAFATGVIRNSGQRM